MPLTRDAPWKPGGDQDSAALVIAAAGISPVKQIPVGAPGVKCIRWTGSRMDIRQERRRPNRQKRLVISPAFQGDFQTVRSLLLLRLLSAGMIGIGQEAGCGAGAAPERIFTGRRNENLQRVGNPSYEEPVSLAAQGIQGRDGNRAGKREEKDLGMDWTASIRWKRVQQMVYIIKNITICSYLLLGTSFSLPPI